MITKLRRLLPGSLGGLTGVACALCCAIPLLLAAGILGGAGWAFLGQVLPGVAVALALFIVLVYGLAALVVGLAGSLTASERAPLTDDEQHPQKWKDMHMASVYTPLSVWLSACGRETVNLDFNEIERILGRKLPPSARRHDVWWHNEDEPTSTHSHASMDGCQRGTS